jgi:hypothetical protein
MARRLRKWEGPMGARHYDLRYLDNQGETRTSHRRAFPVHAGTGSYHSQSPSAGTPESISIDNQDY